MRNARFLIFTVCTMLILTVLSIGQFPDVGQAQPIPLPGRDDPPRVTATRPANGEVNVLLNAGVAADVSFPAIAGNGVDPDSLTAATVYLHPTGNPAAKVAANLNTTGGNDAIILTPTSLLAPNTEYTYVVTSGVKDQQGNSFDPHTMSFTTGTDDGISETPVEFTKEVATLPGLVAQYTTLVIPKDNRLYATTAGGVIRVFNINPDAKLTLAHTISNFTGRALIGMAEHPSSTPNNIVLWVVNNDPYTGGTDGKHFTGRLSKIIGANIGTGSESWSKTDYIDGLPRSRKDHLSNSIVYGPDGALYLTQGSITAMGRHDPAWGEEPEVLLSAAVLRIDPALLEQHVANHGVLNVRTANVDSNDEIIFAQNYGLGAVPASHYDPTKPGAPVTIYATGIRNAYDLIWHSNGQLYVPTNGSAAGGTVPGRSHPSYDATIPCQNRIDKALFGNYTYEGLEPPQVFNVPTQFDYVFRVVGGGYYGHPNPTRCEWVANGGNPTAGVDPAEIVTEGPNNGYVVDVYPDRNWRGYAYQFSKNSSPNGVIEYKTNIYDGNLRGKLLVTRYSLGDDIVALTPGVPNLDIVNAEYGITGFTSLDSPLDLVEDLRNGNIYVAEFGGESSPTGKIALLKPVDPNVAPVVANDSYSVLRDTPLVVGAADGVLKNDSDFNGDPLTALLNSSPSHAQSFNLNLDGSFTYVPVAGYTGVDSFTYKAQDGKTSSPVATVTINVTSTPPTLPPPMTSVPPTETPIPVGGRQLVLNGGFEGGMDAEGVPTHWTVKNGKGEKVKCNKPEKLFAYEGQCAFMFKKSPTENSRLVQKLDVSSLTTSESLVVSFNAQGKNVQSGAARTLVKIRYEDGSKDKLKLVVDKGTTAYTKYAQTTILGGKPTKIKLVVRFNGTKGKYFVDNVSVVAVPVGLNAGFSVNPLDLPQP